MKKKDKKKKIVEMTSLCLPNEMLKNLQERKLRVLVIPTFEFGKFALMKYEL